MSTISSVSGYASAYTSSTGTSRAQRPDAAKLAAELFSKLDTSGQGYLQQSDFEAALGSIASTSGSATISNSTSTSTATTSSTASADALFKAMDTNGDGKLTQTELTDSLKTLANQLDSHFHNARTLGAGGTPPPPPADQDNDGDGGLTKDQLTTMASQLASSDPHAAALMSTAAANFDKADSNGDGKVSFKEAMALQQANASNSSSSATDAVGASSSTSNSVSASSNASATGNSNQEMFGQLMKLLSAYGLVGNGADMQSSTLSISA